MGHYRAQISFQCDTAFVRDALQINPHYFADNAQALADQLKANLLAAASIGPTWPFTIKIYDAEKPPPNYPLYTTTNGTGFKTTGTPREVSLCLSYYATVNRPRWRGRLYIPFALIGGAMGVRPTTLQQNNTLAFRTILTSSLPSGAYMEVWSPTEKNGHGVTNWWVDDEWDIIRSRGMRGTTRVLAP
jgi:hypothetical protein